MKNLSLVVKNKKGEYVTTSKILARGMKIQHSSVTRLIQNYTTELKTLGELVVSDFKSDLGREKIYVLTEIQATFIMNLSKNSKQVVQFKLLLTKAFFEMREQLSNPQAITRKELALMVVQIEEEKEKLEIENQNQQKMLKESSKVITETKKIIKKQEPKVDYFDKLISAEGTYTFSTAAKIFNMKDVRGKKIGQNVLFDLLRTYKIIMRNNNPYQKYVNMGWFEVKSIIVQIGNRQISTSKTVFTQKGMLGIRQMLLRSGCKHIKQ